MNRGQLIIGAKPVKLLFNVAFILLIFIVSACAAQPATTDSIYTVSDSVLIPTRSGIAISAMVVYKKTNTAPLPVVLFYTTYFQEAGGTAIGKRAADHDYVGVVAYARGIRTDLKHYAPFEHEGTDIYDIIEWITKQPWCNGSVGMYSGSYTGFSQWAAVKNIHPGLKTIVPQVAVMPGFDFPMENNVPLSHMLSWSNDNIYKHKPLPRDLPFTYFNTGTSYRSMDSLAGMPNPIFQKWLQHPAYDAYWQSMVPTPAEYAAINIPVLSTTGYYDGSQISALQYFKQHTFCNPHADHYFVIGPYDHMGAQRRPSANLMGYVIDSVANINITELVFQWFDHILKGKPRPALLKDKVNYQVMGTNEWKHAPSMQQINNDTLVFYLSSNRSGATFSLQGLKSAEKKGLRQTVDFKNRESQNNYYTPFIVFDSLDVSNGLVFSSIPFEKEFSINGSFTGNLFATINKKDMDVSLALYEQMPDGTYFFLTRYVGRASYAVNNSHRRLLTPFVKESISLSNTRFVSRKIGKGSRLVILLNINKHPFEVINYGSGKEVADETIQDAGEPLQVKWHPESFIKIPVWKD